MLIHRSAATARWNLSPSTGRGDVDAKLQGLGKLAESGDAAQDVKGMDGLTKRVEWFFVSFNFEPKQI